MAAPQTSVPVGAGVEGRVDTAVSRPAEVRIPARASEVSATPPPPLQPVVRENEVRPAARSKSTPISGPSFLGLNDPPDRRSAGYGSHSSSSSVDYLLDDEEEPRRGWGKLAAVVIALALAGGFGYLRWRQGGFDWLLHDKRPAQTAPAANGTDVGNGPGAVATPDAGTPNAATPNAAAPDSGGTGAASAPAATGATETGGDASAQPATTPNGAGTDTAGAASASTGNDSAKKPDDAAAKAANSESEDNSAEPAAEMAEPVKNPKAEAPHKAPARERKPTPAIASDPTAEAERYIYGRGVRQDCDQGLRLLKSAAQANAKAMMELGSLYSSGTCAPRDLPTAYRWYALALHKDPDNQTLQNALQKLWGRMTQPERQLAIRLSQ